MAGTHWQRSRKDVGYSGNIRATKINHLRQSTELNMFNFGDNVDRDTVDKVERAGDSRLSTNWRQIGDKVESIGDKVDFRLVAVLSTVDFVASV